MEIMPGVHIREALVSALEEAIGTDRPVTFDFNGTTIEVRPEDSMEDAKARAEEALGHKILSREEEGAKLKAEREEREAAYEKARAEAGAMTEAEMREADVPWPETIEELAEYVRALTERPHDYGTCVYAMSMAATAAFNHVAGKLGVTGFQASCADMDILRRIRRMKHGFRIVDYGDLLYPQHWKPEVAPMFREVLGGNRAEWAEKAKKVLADMDEHGPGHGAPRVRKHLQMIAGAESPSLISRMALEG